MSDTWLCDVGIRVTNLERSVEFYTSLLDLVELKRGISEDSAYVLFKDRRSGQRIELNYYSEASPFYTPFTVGEGLDHIEVRARDVPAMLEKLRAKGITPVNRDLWKNAAKLRVKDPNPEWAAEMDLDVWTTSTGHRIAYLPDPDGNLICLYDHPEERWDDPIPDHY